MKTKIFKAYFTLVYTGVFPLASGGEQILLSAHRQKLPESQVPTNFTNPRPSCRCIRQWQFGRINTISQFWRMCSSSETLRYMFLKLWPYKIQIESKPLVTFSRTCNGAFSHKLLSKLLTLGWTKNTQKPYFFLKWKKLPKMQKLRNVEKYEKNSDMPFDQRSLIHWEAWFPPCFIGQRIPQNLFFLKNRKNYPKRKTSKTSRNMPKLAIRPSTRGL